MSEHRNQKNTEFIQKYAPELEKEIQEVKKNPTSVQIENIALISQDGDERIYTADTDGASPAPEDTLAAVMQGNKRFPGTILSMDEDSVTFKTRGALNPSSAQLKLDLSILLELLALRMQALPDSEIVLSLLSGKENVNGKKLKTGFKNAVSLSLSKPVTFIWGPPGTGKTQTLGMIAAEAYSKNMRVLTVSHSNISVDEAALRAHTLISKRQCVPKGSILRYGFPKNEEINERGLNSFQYALDENPDLKARREKRIKRKRELFKELNDFRKNLRDTGRAKPLKEEAEYIKGVQQEINECTKTLKEIKSQIIEFEAEAVLKAKFLGTTISKAVCDPKVYAQDFDVVIFDEVSMAYVPQIICAATSATKHFVCIGDFNQLPPIVKSNSDALKKDIFEYCGVAGAVRDGLNHEQLVMLDEQRRMHPDIANFISGAMYAGLLKNHPVVLEREEMPSKIASESRASLIDLTGSLTYCLKTKDGSKVNLLSALISMAAAYNEGNGENVGIITPYAAQRRLLNTMAADLAGDSKPSKIKCSTVHQFQGSEKDIIIFDAADCYISKYPGQLFTQTQNNLADRLFNVALSRAKSHFHTVAYTDFFKDGLTKKRILRSFLEYCGDNNSVNTIDDLLNFINLKSERFSIFNNKYKSEAYFKDLKAAKKNITIAVPKNIDEDAASLTELLSVLNEAERSGVKVDIVSKDSSLLPQGLRKYVRDSESAFDPFTVIDGEILWYGAPNSDEVFKTARSHPITLRPVFRFEGKRTAKFVLNTLIEPIKNAAHEPLPQNKTVSKEGENAQTLAGYLAERCKCEKCGAPMLLKPKGKKYFLACSEYKKSCPGTIRSINADMVDDFYNLKYKRALKCKNCLCKLVVKNGPYGAYLKCEGCGTNYGLGILVQD